MTRAAVLALLAGAACGAQARAEIVAPPPAAFCEEMRAHHVMSARPATPCGRLAIVRFAYVGFDGATHDDGEIVVHATLAGRVAALLADLRRLRFPIAKARGMAAYEGDDDAAIADNNTSSYNDRTVAGTTSISVHAYGAAIDVNPVQNPYVQRAPPKVSPPSAAAFVDRRAIRPGMVEPVVGVFARHGFTVWGGRWSEPDYQHFQIPRATAEALR